MPATSSPNSVQLIWYPDHKHFSLSCAKCQSNALFPYGYDPALPLNKAKDRGGMGMAQSRALTAYRAHVKLHVIGPVRTAKKKAVIKAMVRNQNVRIVPGPFPGARGEPSF